MEVWFSMGLYLHDILVETEKRGISFDELLTIQEQDEWVYSDGKSTTCVAFILSNTKRLKFLVPLLIPFQVTEFTILGEYKMELPGYNTLEPYANMNEMIGLLDLDGQQ
ncbi:hypothetical protein JHK87_022827 [Glycine soja]|nr:hypothetical protein JHK87_022827 [Glycine soja]